MHARRTNFQNHDPDEALLVTSTIQAESLGSHQLGPPAAGPLTSSLRGIPTKVSAMAARGLAVFEILAVRERVHRDEGQSTKDRNGPRPSVVS